jgi:hypothetical protein
MASPRFIPRNMLAAQCSLVLLWLALAVGFSIVAFNLGAAAIRSADIAVADTANALARMGSSMADRGQSTADIAKAVSVAAASHGMSASIQPFPGKHPLGGSGNAERGRREPFGYVFPAPGVL